MDRTAFLAACESLDLALNERQVQLFEEFENRLYTANEVMNLTRVPKEECWLRHFVDSLLLHPLLPSGATVLDIGTGPGFPAWPLACARPDLAVVALDSSSKMLRFLAQNPLPNLALVNGRAEDRLFKGKMDVVTGRALAPLAIQLELSGPFVAPKAAVIPMRSANERASIEKLDAELLPLGLVLESVEERTLPATDIVRLFPVFRKVGRAALKPRTWAEMKKSPLW